VPGSAGHLIRRFFAVAAARDLDDDELAQVESWLSPAELSLFLAQPAADQRHGYEAGLHAQEHRADRPVVAAAALHDIGKRHSALGPIGRSLATVMIIIGGASRWERAAAYRDHGPIGAEELERAGADSLVVEFARYHHEARPARIDSQTWDLLEAADQPVKASRRRRPPIT
jgi:hypothetical protein